MKNLANTLLVSTCARRMALLVGTSALAMTSILQAQAAVTDYPNGSTSGNPIILTDNTTQLQVTTGSATQSGVISETGGSFGLEKIGAGLLSLTAANTYTGVTTISAGTLQVGNGSNTGSINSTSVVDNATLTFNRADAVSFGGNVSGTGVLTKSGGSLTLTGANTYTGGTTITSGILTVGNGATAGSIVGNVTNNGALIFNRSDAVNFAGIVSGTGSLGQSGTGVLTLSAAQTYTAGTSVSAGTLALSGAGSIATSSSVQVSGILDISATTAGASLKSLSGTGAVALGSKALTITAGTGTSLFGVISGTGSLTIAGGTQFLAGANTYTGGTTVNTGAILSVGSGAATGSIVGNVTNNGTFSFNRTDAVTYAGIISGTGIVNQFGTSVLTLTGVNTFTGQTFIQSGTLALSGAGSVAASSSVGGSGIFDISGTTSGTTVKVLQSAGNVALGAKTLTVGASGFVSGVIADGGVAGGTGGSLIIAAGNQTLTGANTYTGATTINSGAFLSLGSAGTTGSIASASVIDNGTLQFNRTDAVTYAGIVSGAGALTQNGTGVLTLTGANSFTGQTTINAGTLALSGASSLATSSVVLATGTFDISATTGTTIKGLAGAGVVTLGSKTLTIAGGNTFTGSIRDGGIAGGTGGGLTIASGIQALAGANTYTGTTTIASGASLRLGSGVAVGTITSNVVNNGTLTFNTSGTTTFANVISGTGQFSQAAPGTVILTRANTYTSQTNISAGTLALSGAGSIATSSVVTTSTGTIFDISGTTSGASIVELRGSGAVALGSKTLSITQGITQVSIFSGVIKDGGISGGTGGGLAVTGGVEYLTGANTYTGTTTIASGASLVIGNNTATGSIGTGAIVDNGGLVYKLTSASTLATSLTGTGLLQQQGPGTLTVTAAQGYTGATNILGGTLALGGAGNIAASSSVVLYGQFDISQTTGTTIKDLGGPSSGIVQLGAQTLTISNANNEFDGVIQDGGIAGGTGGKLVLTGGTEMLVGANTYTGATTVSGGTLNVIGSISKSAVTVASGASLTGTGTVGSTTIAAGGILAPGASAGAVGTLSVNGNLSLASTAITNIDVTPTVADKVAVTGTAVVGGTVNANFASGTFSPTQYALVTSTGALSGTFSSYNVTGLSTNFSSALSYNANNVFLVLSNAFTAGSTANVNSGTVTVTGNQTTSGLQSSSSGGTVAVSSGATLTSNQSSNTTFSGTITGSGGFAKAGTGTLVLDGVNTYTGLTTASGGVLEIGDANSPGASIAGPVNVTAGGTLSGHGTVKGAVTIGAGGNLQPGGTIGTINVGSATFASGSIYTVETNAAGQANNTIAAGTITINNGTALVVTPDAPLSSYGRTTTYTILQAAGGITGTFSSATSTAASLLPSVTYGGNAVSLTLIRPDLFATAASGANQNNVNAAIVAGGLSSIMTTLAPQSDAVVSAAFSQLSGDIHASLRSAAIEDSRIIRNTVLDHLNGTPADAEYGLTAWAAGFGGYGSLTSDGNSASLHHDSAGVVAGADMNLGDGFRLGLAGAYSGNNANTAGKTSSANGNSGHVIAYAGWSDGLIDLKGGGDFGWGTANVTRTITALGQTNTNRQDQETRQVFAEAGYRAFSGPVSLEPYVGIAAISARTGAFTEAGGTSALSGGDTTETQTYSTLGLRAAMAPMEDLAGLAPHIDLGWQHGFNTLRPNQRLAFQTLGQLFTVQGVSLARDAAAARFGFDFAVAPDAKISLDYDGSFAGRVQNNAVRGGLEWKF